MRCPEADRRLSEWALGELDQEERMAVDAHLAACPACRARADDAAGAARALRSAPLVEPSAARREAAVAAMEQAHREERWPREVRRWRWVAAAAALLVVAGGGAVAARVLAKPPIWRVEIAELRAELRTQAPGADSWRVIEAAGERVDLPASLLVGTPRFVRMRVIDPQGRPAGELTIRSRTRATLLPPGKDGALRVALEEGGLYGTVAEGGPAVRVTGLHNQERFDALAGAFEAGLQEIVALGGAGGATAGRPLGEILRDLEEMTKIPMRTNERLGSMRIPFSLERPIEHPIDRLSEALKPYGLDVAPDPDRPDAFRVVEVLREYDRTQETMRLYARVESGRARGADRRGAEEVAAGNEWFVDAAGVGETREIATAPVAEWRRPEYHDLIARRTALAYLYAAVERTDDGRPELALNLDGTEFLVLADEKPVWLRVNGSTLRLPLSPVEGTEAVWLLQVDIEELTP